MASQRPIRQAQLTLISEILNNAQRYNVCYTPQSKGLIEFHLQQLLTVVTHPHCRFQRCLYVQAYPTLSADYADFTHNDGRTIGMIKMHGTVPITYQNAKYNIPVNIWISERYPQQPPIVYVAPTADMIIKPGHSYVDASGMVQTPAFSHWIPDRSDLMGIVSDMTVVFGREPPLFARSAMRQQQAAYTVYPQTPPQRPVNPPGSSQQQGSYPQHLTAQPYPVAETTATKPTGQTNPVSTDLEAAQRQYRSMMIKALGERVTGSVYALEQEMKPKASTSEKVHSTLRQRAQQIQEGVSLLQTERETYEHNVRVMALIMGEMSAWKTNVGIPEGSTPNGFNAEDVITPRDPIDAQLLKAQGRDLAAEDTLNVLDQMLRKEVIDLDTYLKQVAPF